MYQIDELDILVDDAFADFYRSYEKFENRCSPNTYVMTLAKNRCLNFIRAQNMQKRKSTKLYSLNAPVNDLDGFRETGTTKAFRDSCGTGWLSTQDITDLTSNALSPLDMVSSNESVKKIMKAIDDLSEDYRGVIYKIAIDQLSYHDAGKELGIPTNTVRSRLSRAKYILRNKLKARRIV